jgi:sortase A
MTANIHVPRHSAHEDDETAVLPRVRDDPDQTAVLPATMPPATVPPASVPPASVPPASVPPVSVTPAAMTPERPAEAGATAVLPAVPAAAAAGAAPATDPTGSAPGPTPTSPGPIPASQGPTPAEPAAVRPRRGAADVVRVLARTTGELLITFGVVVLLLAGYEIWGKGAIIHAHQSDLNNQLAQDWGNPSAAPAASGAPPGPPPPGWAIGRLYIPRLNLHWVVVEGVDLKDIRYAPGHYPGTAMPGQLGNFSVAAHREPGMFWDLDRVTAGDTVVVETRTNWYVYRVFQNHIVTPHSVEVVAPVPNRPGVKPTQKDLTLTTCNPKWDNYQRMAVHAQLVQVYPHGVRPTQLGG